MTDRQQTIIEMAQILSKDCGHCEECNCVADNDINCTDYYYAKKLYNAGYRKVGENQIVVDKEEWEDLQGSDEALAKQYTANCILSCELKKAKKEIERLYNIKLDLEHQITQKGLTEYVGADVIEADTRKETAKEILQEVGKVCGDYQWFKNLCKKYGVEVDER